MKSINKILFMTWAVLMLSACSSHLNTTSKDLEQNFKIVVPITDMNGSLIIAIDSDKEVFRPDDKIPLSVENMSAQKIRFDYADNYIKLFIVRDNQWIEVENDLTYSGSRILSPVGTLLLNLDYTWVRPVFKEDMFDAKNKERLLRIVMIGEILERDLPSGNQVGAYVDVYIRP